MGAPSVHPQSGGDSLPYIDGADFLVPFQDKCENICKISGCFGSGVDNILLEASSRVETGSSPNSRKLPANSGLLSQRASLMSRYTQALHTYRINLSPFTKDFRV